MKQTTDEKLREYGLALIGLVNSKESQDLCIVNPRVSDRKPSNCWMLKQGDRNSCTECAARAGVIMAFGGKR